MTGDVGRAIRLRDLRLDDLPGALRLSHTAGWNQGEVDWRLLLGLNPRRFVAAVAGGRVVGTGGAACYDDALAWICMILVDPEYRGLGIARGVTRAVLERVGASSCIGLDATPAGLPVYARLGFVEHRRVLRMFRAADPAVEAGPGSAARRLAEADLPEVLAVDREVFGADRGALLRRACAQAPSLAWRTGEAEATGYCFGRRGHHSVQIGPVVAPTVGAARDVVIAALATTAGHRVIVDAIADRGEWLSALRELGFEEERPLTRMYRGAPPVTTGAERLVAIFGPEFG